MIKSIFTALFIFASTQVSAGILFQDDFDSGSFSSGWANTGSRIIVTDPALDQNDKALTFSSVSCGFNITTDVLPSTSNRFEIDSDYLGTYGAQDCGGSIRKWTHLVAI